MFSRESALDILGEEFAMGGDAPPLYIGMAVVAAECEIEPGVAYMRTGCKHLMLDTSWKEYANCLGVDPDLFFPTRGQSTREAKAVCRGCVVVDDCLEFALVNGEKFGIWGGLSERERRRIRRQRAVERQQTASQEPGN